MVVLPLVPVTAVMVMAAAGLPNQFRPARARASRLSRTSTQGPSSSGRSWQRTQAAPLVRAMGMNLCPSVS